MTTVSQIDPIWFFCRLANKPTGSLPTVQRDNGGAGGQTSGKSRTHPGRWQRLPHKGKFAFIDRQVDAKTGTIQIAVSFPNPELTLRPGQYGIARAEIETIPNALLIPQQAVSQLQGNDQVAVVNPDGKAEIRAVKVGATYRTMIVVTEGLKVGEKVIVEGFQRVRQGMPVSAKPYTERDNREELKNDQQRIIPLGSPS